MKRTVIETNHLVKTYRRYKKKEGIRGSLTGLWKREYEEKTAINQIDLSISEGEFIGLIGPNGAGKTTLIKMLTGIIAPTQGHLDVLGSMIRCVCLRKYMRFPKKIFKKTRIIL